MIFMWYSCDIHVIFMWYSCDIHVAPAGEVFHLDPWNWRWLRSDGCADDGVFCESFGLCHGQMVVKVTERIAWQNTFQHDAKKLPRPKHGLRELCLEKPNRLGNESGPKLHTLRAHHQECMFHMWIRPQKRALVAAPFEHKPTDSQMHSPLPSCEETNCNGLFLGRHVARKQARGAKPRVDHCSSNPRPPVCDYAPRTSRLRPSNPHVNKGLRPF